ncbi:DUF1353 domain-containing protein [Thauera butanivorans]|uniref:DUF1353 domain-containing protein n=1 Tax=Thauera butanivorans TaxID=86174 RepID=UPI0008383287|nr:DUF1353 domain-containing protein [Thauera butanivorans]
MFRTAPVLRACAEAGRWRLELPVVWETPAEIIVIPPGFLTDLASIPRIFHSLIPVNGRHRSAAILHDYLFVVQDRPRDGVDALFLRAMEASGVRWTQRTAMYLAVRLAGWLPWQRNADALAADARAFLARHGLERR